MRCLEIRERLLKTTLCARIIDPCPAVLLRRCSFFCLIIKESIRIQPEILEIAETAIQTVLAECLKHIAIYRSTVLCHIPINGINKVSDVILIQKIFTVFPKRRLQCILHQVDHDQRGAGNFTLPVPAPVTRAFHAHRNRQVRDQPLLLKRLTGFLHGGIPPVMVRHI